MRSVAPVLAVLTAFGGAAPVWGAEASPLQRLCDRCISMNAERSLKPPQLFALKCRIERSPQEQRFDVIVVMNGSIPVCSCRGALEVGTPMDGEEDLAWRRMSGADAMGQAPPDVRPHSWLYPTRKRGPGGVRIRRRVGDFWTNPATRPPRVD